METINNVVTAAAEAVWPSANEHNGNNTNAPTQTRTQAGSVPRSDAYNSGTTSGSVNQLDNTQEPLSGVLGNTKKGEPYDAGNKADQDAALDADRSSSFSEDNASYTAGGSSAYTSSGTNTNRNAAGTSEAAGAAGLHDSKVANTSVDDGSAAQTHQDGRTSFSPNEGSAPHRSGNNTSSTASVASGKVAGGGRVGGTPGGAPGGASGGLPAPVGDDAAKEVQTESQGEGTGEKYIRSTGLKADGGDFDAAREGAGREADRLLDQKGIAVTKQAPKHEDSPGTNPSSHSHGTSNTSSEKKSLGEKIKEKLHHKQSGA